MKFGVSNLAWDRSQEAEAFDLLRQFNATGIEVAPTRIASWEELTPVLLEDYRRKCEAFGLEISSMQAILFNRPEARLLSDDDSFEKLADHMEQVGVAAQHLGASVAVFGAPGNRQRGALSVMEAKDVGLPRMRRLGDIAAKYGYMIGIEPVPQYYKCDFLDRIDEVANFVEDCAHDHVVTHFDIACVTLGGDDPAQALERHSAIAHFHASEPDLAGFDDPKCDHESVAQKLKEVGYDNWVVIEMRQAADSLKGLETALDYISRVYAFV